jgi:hypothetical protein
VVGIQRSWSENLVSDFSFHRFKLYRYSPVYDEVVVNGTDITLERYLGPAVGICRLNQVDP